ncbi:MAG: hypothetical protein JW759_00850 [Candidatus Coatesbacteria bacterium]|nr:hypothetical protein [Candidatus Coatesbacteria bacterium]
MTLGFNKEGPYADEGLPGRGATLITLNVHGVGAGILVNSDRTRRAARAAFGYFIEDARADSQTVAPHDTAPLFAFFEAPRTPSGARDEMRIILRYPTGEYFESSELAPLLPLLIGIVTQSINQRLVNLCIIHGASLCLNGAGVILFGGSGSGKTTLALALSQNGFAFLSDEFAAIDITSHLLLPFPRPMLPRENTMRLLGLSTDGRYAFDEADGRRYLIDPTDGESGVNIGKSAPIRAVFILERTPGRPAARPAASAKTLESIADNLINASHLPTHGRVAMLDVLFDVVRDANCWTLYSSSLPETVNAVLRAVEYPAPGDHTVAQAHLTTVYRSAREKLEALVGE